MTPSMGEKIGGRFLMMQAFNSSISRAYIRYFVGCWSAKAIRAPPLAGPGDPDFPFDALADGILDKDALLCAINLQHMLSPLRRETGIHMLIELLREKVVRQIDLLVVNCTIAPK